MVLRTAIDEVVFFLVAMVNIEIYTRKICILSTYKKCMNIVFITVLGRRQLKSSNILWDFR